MENLFDKILICIDNGRLSDVMSDMTTKIAAGFGSAVVGLHAYNAVMHEDAFRIMEPTLPAQYQKEEILQKQRNSHTDLISVGMEKISLSYLKPIEQIFNGAGIEYRSKVKEGKNFKALNQMIAEEDGDLVVIGSSSFNGNGNGNGKGYLGSVCLRVLRDSGRRDVLVVKKAISNQNPRFLVGLDGSAASVEALYAAKHFALKFNGRIHTAYVFDSNLHKDIFLRLKDSLINSDGFKFNTKDQEKMHDLFIDKGLERVGEMILDRAESEVFGDSSVSANFGDFGLAKQRGLERPVKMILEGHIHNELCAYGDSIGADIIFIGRTGRHFIDDMDIGSIAENVVRYAGCNVFISKHKEYNGWEV
ncbi:universal stress protein UspA [Candidatus Magnetoovum chiemensis]|nr:universal stress protein UspA [Candidatus Magnetoovum chiemensis]